ncbi:MAG: SDR family oxidoreductase [Rhodospirillaceae bacterium]|nr:SDR family oxidoreductase [Rhodospirillaceae bacterium]
MKRLLAAILMVGLMSAHAHAATVLVTGSNRGIGLEFARQYAAAGWTVIATTRNPAEAKDLNALAAKNKSVTVEKLDLLDLPGIKALAAKYKGKPIDLLINNAGLLGDAPGQTLGTFDRKSFDAVFGTNVFGTLSVTEAFKDNVVASQQKKIVSLTSIAGSVTVAGAAKNNPYWYRASKAAMHMGMRAVAADLKDKGVIVGIIGPGSVDTEMYAQYGTDYGYKDPGVMIPAQSVEKIIKIIETLDQTSNNKLINSDGKTYPF